MPEVLTYVNDNLAVAHPELEARLSDQGVRMPGQSRPVKFDPHIISEATRQLVALGAVERVAHSTKGSRIVELLVPGDLTGRSTAVKKAVRRKGMLVGRLNKLTAELGKAGEMVTRHSLASARGSRLSPEVPGYEAAARFLNVRLRGPLDSAAWVQTVNETTGIRTLSAVPIEVKNKQQTIYPIHKEIHQLLEKAALLQTTHPSQPIVPVFVCRRAHQRLFWMAKNLGFLVTEFTGNAQYVLTNKDVNERKLEEIRDELHLPYLTILDDPLPRLREFFETTLPTRAPAAAARWAVTAPLVLPYADELRREGPDAARRLDAIRELRQEIETEFAKRNIDENVLTWSLPDLPDD